MRTSKQKTKTKNKKPKNTTKRETAVGKRRILFLCGDASVPTPLSRGEEANLTAFMGGLFIFHGIGLPILSKGEGCGDACVSTSWERGVGTECLHPLHGRGVWGQNVSTYFMGRGVWGQNVPTPKFDRGEGCGDRMSPLCLVPRPQSTPVPMDTDAAAKSESRPPANRAPTSPTIIVIPSTVAACTSSESYGIP
jgi:hypothetical protein